MSAYTFGWKKDLPDQRDFLFSEHFKTATTLPASVDLRQYCSKVEDQGNLGSCTANSAVGALEYLENKDGGSFVDLSRLFLYYNTRVIEHTTRYDSGCTLRDTVKSLVRYGACNESSFPYIERKFRMKPSQACYTEGSGHTVTGYYRIRTLNDMKNALASGMPFIFGVAVYESFVSDDAAETGIIPMPSRRESCEGGHALCCVGYDDTKEMFIFRNSWGESWGDKGYGYIPYQYLTNSYLAGDFWCITKANGI